MIKEIAAVLLGVLPLLKKKLYCLWYWNRVSWVSKGGPFSGRQCKKTRKELVALGMDPERFVILRKGVTPDAPPAWWKPQGK